MSSRYVKTETVLDRILAHKVTEIEARKRSTPLDTVQRLAQRVSPPLDMIAALRRDTVALIAEVKKASPSRGILLEDMDPIGLGRIYAENGAAAISVLTDERFFQGNLEYLKALRDVVDLPLLRKDFVIDPYQVYTARMARADAVLLIVAALSDERLHELHDLIQQLGMTALVEVHNEEELTRALRIGARLIGINNRDLKSFEVDLNTTAHLAKSVPDDVTLVAESGIMSADDVQQMGALGAHAVLVGESLVTSEAIPAAVHAYSSQPRRPQRS